MKSLFYLISLMTSESEPLKLFFCWAFHQPLPFCPMVAANECILFHAFRNPIAANLQVGCRPWHQLPYSDFSHARNLPRHLGMKNAFCRPNHSTSGRHSFFSCIFCALPCCSQTHLDQCAQLSLGWSSSPRSCNRKRQHSQCGSLSPGWSSSPKSCSPERHHPQCGSLSLGWSSSPKSCLLYTSPSPRDA